MLFNSFEFLIFLPIVFVLYWWVFGYAMRGSKHQLVCQNALVVVASYLFYGWWDWRFLLLIAFTTICSYTSGIAIGRSQVKWHKKAWMLGNVLINLFILGIYKYYDFFVGSLANLLQIDAQKHLLHLILPVGISFYTFQALSYSIDVYKGKLPPTTNLLAFTAFLSFFPQLVAGPIERATNLLPQFLQKRTFNYADGVDGLRQMLWGMFKKVVVADNCAFYVDQIFANIDSHNAGTLAVAAVLFTFQIYGDFSGYSDIAIGLGKLFGIKLMRNFNVPYFSRDIAEFWRRWHISLTTWFRDYVYIPLGGSRPDIPQKVKNPALYKKAIIVRNTFIIFLLSGFWHGANWTFVLWGAYHAMLFLPLILLEKNRKYTNVVATLSPNNPQPGLTSIKRLPTLLEIGQMALTFVLAVLGWIIFRSDSIEMTGIYLSRMLDVSLWGMPYLTNKVFTFLPLLIMLGMEWFNRAENHGLAMRGIHSKVVRYGIYMVLSLLIIISMGPEQNFIYFQF
ncbi:MAG: MBOAT family O-acyltransferase [Paludibacteraceae bacterium]|nr:MBOAT family O-acyltransferase [Paludibacteraceae bacterium]